MAINTWQEALNIWEGDAPTDIQRKVQLAEFKLVNDVGFAQAYNGHSNIEKLNFTTDDITLLTGGNGYFDFTLNEVSKVDAVIDIGSDETITLASDGDYVSFVNEDLFIETGAFNGLGLKSLSIVAYIGNDTKGVVICGPNLRGSNLVLSFT